MTTAVFQPEFERQFMAFVSKADLTGVGTSGVQNLYLRKVDGSSTKLFSAGSGTGANAPVYTPVITNDSRYVAYVSAASNLVAGDSNGTSDVFLYDRATGLTHRVSVDSAGGQADGSSSMPSISDDGNVIAFESKATNLVPGDSNGLRDLFVRNRSAGTTTRVSVDASGAQPNGISYHSTLTRDGSRVAFASQASNLVAGDTNNVVDVFQRLVADPTSIDRASRNFVGDVQGDGPSDLPSYDSDDNDLAFRSSSTNLDWANVVSNNEIFLANRASQTAHVVGRSQAAQTDKVSEGIGGAAATTGDSVSGPQCMSADGRFVVFESASSNLVGGDTNAKRDIFVLDRKTGNLTIVSLDSAGQLANGDSTGPASISANGRFVAFNSGATNLVAGDTNGQIDVFVRDLQTGQTERVSVGPSQVQANSFSIVPQISSNGRYVCYMSLATNLVSFPVFPSFNAYVWDRVTGTTTLVSKNSSGIPGNAMSDTPSLSGDGSCIVFRSLATNLAADSPANVTNIFAHKILTGETTCVSVGLDGKPGLGFSDSAQISSNGRFVTFSSTAANLVATATMINATNVFVRDLALTTTGIVSNTERAVEPQISADGRRIVYKKLTSTNSSLMLNERSVGSTLQIGLVWASSLLVRASTA